MALSKSQPDLDDLVQKLTTEEKVLLLGGANFWETNGIERLQIPRLKVSDGPNGARGESFNNGKTSACFPASVSLAASFNETLVRHIGEALGQETRTKGARVLLGPTICPHRHPTGGRNFESFSEDPLLAGRLATLYIQGVQSQGVGATVKHYALNEQETNRFTIDAHASERALREIYLKPFEIAIKQAKPWSLMTSYNLVNGVHADSNRHLLIDILREQWGYEGHVMSDWGATNSVADSLNAGLDLEMPGPAVKRTSALIQKALDSGDLSMNTLDKRVKANLRLLQQCGLFEDPTIPPEQAIDLPEHRALIRKAGAEGAVLLKNDNSLLPIQKDKVQSIALIGLAKEFLGHGGGSAAVNAHHKINAYNAFQEALGGKADLKYAEGARAGRNLPTFSDGVLNLDGNPGFSVQCFGPDDTLEETLEVPNALFRAFSTQSPDRIVMSGTYTPTVTGKHYLSFATTGNTKVYINEELLYDLQGKSNDIMDILLGCANDEIKRYEFVAGEKYHIRIDITAVNNPGGGPLPFMSGKSVGINMGFVLEKIFEADLTSEAVDIAKSCDVALVFVGNDPNWETEGSDRNTMDLPKDGSLDKLISSVARANPKTIVINSTGSPISMPWIAEVPAVLQTWFAGQEAGHAIADVLLGVSYPGGKLPVTFPKRLSDTPAFANFPGDLVANRVNYDEGIYIGYRHYDKAPDSVLFPFGHGLSYSTFSINNSALSSRTFTDNQTVTVTVDVTNTGARASSEVVQIYVGPPKPSSTDRPLKELKGFAKVHLEPESKQSVHVHLNRESFSYFDEAKSKWVVEAGTYQIFVGTSSTQIHAILELDVPKVFQFSP